MLKDNISVFEEEEAKREKAEMENSPDGFDLDEGLFNSLHVYRFSADGGFLNDIPKEKRSLYEGLIDENAVSGDVYCIYYSDGYPGAYETGWVVIYDVDLLFSKVFVNEESIISAIGSENCRSYMNRFFKILDENGIRYNDDFFLMD